MSEAWLINPHRKRRVRRKRNKPKRSVRIMAANPRRRRRRHRKNPGNPRRRRRAMFMTNRHRRRRARRNPFFSSRRRHYRRNPPGVRSLMRPVMWGAAGLMGEKFIFNTLTPMVGATVTGSPVTRIAWKLACAYLAAWGVEMLGGPFEAAFIGGSADAAQDVISSYVSPLVPQISGMGLYRTNPGLSGMGLYQFPNQRLSIGTRHDAIAS